MHTKLTLKIHYHHIITYLSNPNILNLLLFIDTLLLISHCQSLSNYTPHYLVPSFDLSTLFFTTPHIQISTPSSTIHLTAISLSHPLPLPSPTIPLTLYHTNIRTHLTSLPSILCSISSRLISTLRISPSHLNLSFIYISYPRIHRHTTSQTPIYIYSSSIFFKTQIYPHYSDY